MMDILKLMVGSLPAIVVVLGGFFRMQVQIAHLTDEVNRLRIHRHAEDTRLTEWLLTQGEQGVKLNEHERRITSLENSRRNA